MLALLIGILKAPVTEFVDCPVTCFETNKFEDPRLTVDTLLLPTGANKPPFSDTTGDPTTILVWTAADGRPPSHTPLTSVTASTFAVVTPTLSIRLKLSTAWPATGYLTISPTFKLEITVDLPVTTPLVAIWTWSATPIPDTDVFCKTTSPIKLTANPVIPLVPW